MSILDKEIERLEKLAMLDLTKEQKSQLATDFKAIIGMIDKLDELELEDVEPLLFVNESGENRLREDGNIEHLDRSLALGQARQSEDAYFTVPKVLKK